MTLRATGLGGRGLYSPFHKEKLSWETAIDLDLNLSFLASKFLRFMAVESRKTPNMLMHLEACEQSVLVLSLLLSDSVGFVPLPTE